MPDTQTLRVDRVRVHIGEQESLLMGGDSSRSNGICGRLCGRSTYRDLYVSEMYWQVVYTVTLATSTSTTVCPFYALHQDKMRKLRLTFRVDSQRPLASYYITAPRDDTTKVD